MWIVTEKPTFAAVYVAVNCIICLDRICLHYHIFVCSRTYLLSALCWAHKDGIPHSFSVFPSFFLSPYFSHSEEETLRSVFNWQFGWVWQHRVPTDKKHWFCVAAMVFYISIVGTQNSVLTVLMACLSLSNLPLKLFWSNFASWRGFKHQ